MHEQFDVVVVGGGPGGSTAASFVAMDGHRVLLLEREHFPRFQIGESLIPSTVHGICKMLGIFEEVEQAKFMYKLGGTFRWGKEQKPWNFNFDSAEVLHGAGYAYQVERARFDEMLLRNAARKGVTVREGASVSGLLEEGDRVAGVRYVDEAGQEHAVKAKWVVDASGNGGRLHQRVGQRVFSKFFQNVALFGYFEGGKRLPAPNDGNILCVAFDEGWFWYIPLTPTLTSVGAVVAKQHAEQIKAGGLEQALRGYVDRCPLIKEYLAGATRVTQGMYGELRVRKDYSYLNTKFWIPGLVLVGDSACFIDPVFSSGVHLATYSALQAARSINTSLRGALDEKACFDEFEQRYRREYGLFNDFLLAFYDMHAETESYFWSARKVLSTEERAHEAFVRLVGGGATGAADFFDQRKELGNALNTMAAALVQGVRTPEADHAAVNVMKMRHTLAESWDILHQANAAPIGATPLFEGGLVPTRDGFHWAAPTPP